MLKIWCFICLSLFVMSCSPGSYESYTKKRDQAAAMERVYLDKKKTYVSRNPNREAGALEEAKAKAKFAHKANQYRQKINKYNEKLSLLRIKGLSENKKPNKDTKKSGKKEK